MAGTYHSNFRTLSEIKDLEKVELKRTPTDSYGYYFIEWRVDGIGKCYTINNNFDDE